MGFTRIATLLVPSKPWCKGAGQQLSSGFTGTPADVPGLPALPRVPSCHCGKVHTLMPFPRCRLCFCWHCDHTGEGIFSISFKEAKLLESSEIIRELGVVITNEIGKWQRICSKHKMLHIRLCVLNLFQMLLFHWSLCCCTLLWCARCWTNLKSHLIHWHSCSVLKARHVLQVL